MKNTLLLLLFISSLAFAAEPVSKSFFGGIAIEGHDTVAYHSPEVRESHNEVIGKKTFTVEWAGANWRFTSQASADKFAANPSQYKPQYNGHCANALSLGEGLIHTDGTVWEFFDNSLHLFYAERGRQRWLNGDWKSYKEQADKAWKEITQ
ncbi:YHS domain-containing (seleno)protein [Amphritea japonica]|uniref:YHS domain-containing protein n=1 Tax=Amphritea japonica ATCC BAA-1530 TaxID=1278309 RepID=A0A7R6SS49_9GAMM|nr:YHS domain-containing (seleno)protein [Amphritea japonica]BBB25855.1 conserved hypothetical protein [Amphritea japonica ATCC BAA-1530]